MIRAGFRLYTVFCLWSLWLCAPTSVWAESHGGIEIGAKGIRAIVVDIPGNDGEPKILMIENKNTTLVAELASTKMYSPKSLDETARLVGQFAKKMRDEFKIPDQRLYVVGSSGIFVPLEGDADLIKANKELLVKAIQESTKLTMDFVTIVREAELTITSVVPAPFRYESVLLDIGSGNTKGGADQKETGLVTFGISFGTISFFDQIKKEAKLDNFAASAARLRKELVLPALQGSLKGNPELTRRKKVYLAGGSVWALTTFMKPADRGEFVTLTHGDIGAFQKLLLDNPKDLPNPDLNGITKEDVKRFAAKDLAAVRKTFSRDQLIAGVEILNALSEGFQLDAPDKLARNAYIGWILGYTMEKGTRSR
jgi:hypothetical protein